MAKKRVKTCFVIAPIGVEGSEIRNRSDKILKHIITPVAKDCGYKTIRADKISKPGIITSQIIQHLVDDDLVIADLTGRNPNVFYELAIRHAKRKPIVQIIQAEEKIPFDVAATRTIPVNHNDLDSVFNCKKELIKQIKSVEKDPMDVDTPISVAIDLKSLRKSGDLLKKSNAKIITMLQDIHFSIREIDISSRPRIDPILLEGFDISIKHMLNIATLSKGGKPTKAKFKKIQEELARMNYILYLLGGDSGITQSKITEIFDRPFKARQLK